MVPMNVLKKMIAKIKMGYYLHQMTFAMIKVNINVKL